MSCIYYNPYEPGGSNCGTSCESCQGGCQSECENNQSSCQTGCKSSCQTTCQGSCQTTCEKSCQTACQTSCESAAQRNRTPTTPSTISVPTQVKGGATLNATWSAATDADGNLRGYELQRSVNNGAYTTIYTGTLTSYTDTVTVGWLSLRYRVRAYDTYNAYSSYATSAIVTVTNNTAPSITGRDEDLGGKRTAFNVTYQVNDEDAGDTLTVVEKLNGEVLRTITNADKKADYTISISAAKLLTLPLGENNTLEVSVTDSKNAITYRRYTFKRLNTAPTITLVTAEDMGEVTSPFEIKYKVNDIDGDDVDVQIKYGDKILEAKQKVAKDTQLTFTLTKLQFMIMDRGPQMLTIEAMDTNGATMIKAVRFTRKVTSCGYKYIEQTATRRTGITVSVFAKLAEGNVFTIKACNNANDANPTWETIAPDNMHTFTNTTKTAANWAFGVYVNIERGDAMEDAYLETFGGATTT